MNSRRRNEAWKEIRLMNNHHHDDEMEFENEEGVRVGEVSDDESRVNACRHHQSLGALFGECCICEGSSGGGIVSDDNDLSCGEESKTSTGGRAGSSPSSSSFVVAKQKKRKSVDDSSFLSEDCSSQRSFFGSSPPQSSSGVVVPPRRVNTIGAGLAYGTDAWRSYQSRLDVRGSTRLSSSLGR